MIGKIAELLLCRKDWTCAVCGDEVFDGEYFCQRCKKKLPYNSGKICNHCGRPTDFDTEYCLTCKNNLTHFERSRSVFIYNGEIARLIKKFKYNNARWLAEVFAKELSVLYYKSYFNADCLVPVPMDENSLKRRRYNQTVLLANELSQIIGLPVNDCVEKRRKTEHQAGLNRLGRLQNLKDGFRVADKKAIAGKSALIIDDVTTTGATAEVLATTLLGGGAKTVNVITVATALGNKISDS